MTDIINAKHNYALNHGTSWDHGVPPPGTASLRLARQCSEKEKPVRINFYDELMTRVNKAIQGKPVATVTYIWMQGEADAENGWGEVYEESFYGVLDQLKADLKTDKVNYVLGRINDYWLPSNGVPHGDLVRGIQQRIGDAHPHGDWVDTDDFNRGLNPWNVYQLCDGHFPTPAYKVLGERFARKACLLIDPKLKLGDEIFRSGHEIRFTYGRNKSPDAVDPQSLLALAPGPLVKGAPIHARFFRIRITAPKVMIDEIIVNPSAAVD